MIRVLVADDDMSIRGIVSQVLTDDGFDVTEAANGKEALEAFKADPFDVVMTDIRMPGMDGLSLLAELKGIDEHVHVVVMTSHASMESSIKALKRGAYDYLIKPFEDLELISSSVKRAVESLKLQRERDLLITSLTRQNKELDRLNKLFRELAIRDGLTSLYNHRYAQESLHAEINRALRFQRDLSVLFIDVDSFKHYNDTHGHQQGDRLLQELAHVLRDHTREMDVVARWGGEEFIVIAPETDAAQATQLAAKLCKSIREHRFEGREQQPKGSVTVCIGIAWLTESLRDAAQLVYVADQGVYTAKKRGRDQYCTPDDVATSGDPLTHTQARRITSVQTP